MTEHFIELKNQVNFLLSVRHAAQTSIIGQITDFKANLLESNQMNENASIKVIVDEVWNSYDVNNNGWLEKSEMKKFVKEFMPEMK